jgi:hypothetical protein
MCRSKNTYVFSVIFNCLMTLVFLTGVKNVRLRFSSIRREEKKKKSNNLIDFKNVESKLKRDGPATCYLQGHNHYFSDRKILLLEKNPLFQVQIKTLRKFRYLSHFSLKNIVRIWCLIGRRLKVFKINVLLLGYFNRLSFCQPAKRCQWSERNYAKWKNGTYFGKGRVNLNWVSIFSARRYVELTKRPLKKSTLKWQQRFKHFFNNFFKYWNSI